VFAETVNEHEVKSITDRAAFDRVFYETMQAVINSHPNIDRLGEDYQPNISATCSIDIGNTCCITNYELYNGEDKLVSTLTLLPSGSVERGLIAGALPSTKDLKTGEEHGGTDLLLSENGKLVSANWRTKADVRTLREHW
jgi:hypothetical protein